MVKEEDWLALLGGKLFNSKGITINMETQMRKKFTIHQVNSSCGTP